MRVGILTGGGDAPGLNSVIYALVRMLKNWKPDCEIIGYKSGYKGLYKNDYVKLTPASTSGILNRGGTILYSSNKDNLFDYFVKDDNGNFVKKDVSDVAIKNMKDMGIEILIVLGGDGTLTSARDFSRKGINVIGVPKTIDNDLGFTDSTFGFDTAVNIVAENLGRIHTTAESHHRIFVVEVMGRNAGWIALRAGLAGSADVILIPEIPYELNKVVEKIKQRDRLGKHFSIIVVTEGAKEKGGQAVIGKIVSDSPDPVRFGGIGAKIAHDLELIVKDHEVRSVALGHIQRGGEPSAADRILSLRYAYGALNLIQKKKFGSMVCLKNNEISYVSLEEVAEKPKFVDPNGELVNIAKSLGIYFGD